MYHEDFFDECVNAIKDKRVEEIMKKDFVTIELSSNTMALMADFLQTDTHFVPVMENNKVV
jgi:CBS-domain-containing membrane protein